MNVHTLFQAARVIILIVLVSSGITKTSAQTVAIAPDILKKTFTFASKDSADFQLDVYSRADLPANSPCVLFVFGGGFIHGTRDNPAYNNYFNTLVKNNYVVASISYRLGLKGVKKVSPLNVKPLKHAIDMAVDDLYDATNWMLSHAVTLHIDPSMIILSGSSAGAITVLQGDFEKRNNTKLSKKLPETFQYAGVVSFAGAILSFNGALRYKNPPAPTLLFHGTADRLVTYDKIRFFNKGFYGSSHIAKIFRKSKYPYYIYREAGMGHEVAITPADYNQTEILWFLREYVVNRKSYQLDVTFDNLNKKRPQKVTPHDLYSNQ
jgi:predicted esterase